MSQPWARAAHAAESADRRRRRCFPLNFSHGASSHHAEVAARIAAGEPPLHRALADLQGPKIRIGGFATGSVELTAGDPFCLDLDVPTDGGDQRRVGVEYRALPEQVVMDDVLLLDDGKLRVRVDDVAATAVDCTVITGGRLASRKGVNKLGGGLAAPALTEKDRADIAAMADIAPDFVAVSFVSSCEDIDLARSLLGEVGLQPAIIAKIERAEVVADTDLLDSIIRSAEGVMVARGDLGVEVGDAQLIGIQKDLISRTRRLDRLVITATQMMESMISNRMPTRAEVFDVANAVLDGTDAVMLSAETAVGQYPVEGGHVGSRSWCRSAPGGAHFPAPAGPGVFQCPGGDRPVRHVQRQPLCRCAGNRHSPSGGHTHHDVPPILRFTHFRAKPAKPDPAKLALCRGVVPLYFDAGLRAGGHGEGCRNFCSTAAT